MLSRPKMKIKYFFHFAVLISTLLILLMILNTIGLHRLSILFLSIRIFKFFEIQLFFKIGQLEKILMRSAEPSSQALSGSTTTKSTTNLPLMNSSTTVRITSTTTSTPDASNTNLPVNSTTSTLAIMNSTTVDDWILETTSSVQPIITGSTAVNQDELSHIPYGEAAGDESIPKMDDVSFAVPINISFRYFKKSYTTFYVGSNGLLSFFPYTEHTPRQLPITNSPIICPFWSDIDITKQGDVYYRIFADEENLKKVDFDINTYYKPSKSKPADFKSTWAFVVTWSECSSHTSTFYSTPSLYKNTFQLVLASNEFGNETYGIYNYMKLEWPNYFFSHQKFLAGYNGDNSYLVQSNFVIIEKINFINLINRSNVNKPGKWIYKFTDGD